MKKHQGINPHLLAEILRTAADGIEKVNYPIEIPQAVKKWLRAMVRLGNTHTVLMLDDEK